VLQAVRDRRLEIVVSWKLAEEIAQVLRRPWLGRYGVTERDIRSALELLAPQLPSVEVDPPIRDPSDAPVVSTALAAAAEAIVTGDKDFLADDTLLAWLRERGIAVWTAAELVRRLA